MKIAIIGYSGSGKSTLANMLKDKLNIPVLHLDKISFYPKWINKSLEERKEKLEEFLDNNSSWVIDGNYVKNNYERRMNEADIIIYLNFNRFTCYFSALKRAFVYRNKKRESAPDGCKEKFSLSFQWWVLFKGRTKKHKELYVFAKENYRNKFIELKNRKQVNNFIREYKF